MCLFVGWENNCSKILIISGFDCDILVAEYAGLLTPWLLTWPPSPFPLTTIKRPKFSGKQGWRLFPWFRGGRRSWQNEGDIMSASSPTAARHMLVADLRRYLVGPVQQEESFQGHALDRYHTGFLSPSGTQIDAEEDDIDVAE